MGHCLERLHGMLNILQVIIIYEQELKSALFIVFCVMTPYSLRVVTDVLEQ
jgi:hypothetical protein